jgi:hypothetical protein
MKMADQDEAPKILDVLLDLHPVFYLRDITNVLDLFVDHCLFMVDSYREDHQLQPHEIGRDRMWQEMADMLNSPTLRGLTAGVSWQPFIERFEQREDLKKTKEDGSGDDLLYKTLEELYGEYSLCTLLDALQTECRWIADDIDEGELKAAVAGQSVNWRAVADALEPLVLRADEIEASWKPDERT